MQIELHKYEEKMEENKKKITRERKKNCLKGYRSELSEMLMSYGIIPFRDLKNLPNSQAMYSKKLKMFMAEKRIRIEELRDDDDYKKVAIIRGVPSAWKDYFEQNEEDKNGKYGIARYQNVLKKCIKDAQSGIPVRQMRAFRISEVSILMQTSGIMSLYLDKPHIWNGKAKIVDLNMSYFYTPYELTYEEIRSMEDGRGDRKSIMSRYCGVMITPMRDYTIYHMGPRRFKWSNRKETGYKIEIERVIREKNNLPERKNHQDAIFYVNNNNPIISLLDPQRKETNKGLLRSLDESDEKSLSAREYEIEEKTVVRSRDVSAEENNSTIISIKDDAYDKMYVLGIDGDESKIMLHNMTYYNWEEILMQFHMSGYDISKRSDGVNGATGVRDIKVVRNGKEIRCREYAHLFCISELKEFHRFLEAVKALKTIEEYRFKVICYDHQRKLVEEVVERGVEIETVELKKIEDIILEKVLCGYDRSEEALEKLPARAHGVKDNMIVFLYCISNSRELYEFLDTIEELDTFVEEKGYSLEQKYRYKIMCYEEQSQFIEGCLETYNKSVQNKCEVEIISRSIL